MDHTARRKLENMNPCKSEYDPQKNCQYSKNCSELVQALHEPVCLSKMAYMVAQYLLIESETKTSKEYLTKVIGNRVGEKVVDPEKGSWSPVELKPSDIERIVDVIISRGQELYKEALPKSITKPGRGVYDESEEDSWGIINQISPPAFPSLF